MSLRPLITLPDDLLRTPRVEIPRPGPARVRVNKAKDLVRIDLKLSELLSE